MTYSGILSVNLFTLAAPYVTCESISEFTPTKCLENKNKYVYKLFGIRPSPIKKEFLFSLI